MNDIQKNMRKIAKYNKMVSQAYSEDEKAHMNKLSREIKLQLIDLHTKLNEKMFAELRKDIMTLGVGCISLFESIIFSKCALDMSDEELDRVEDWKITRDQIFDNINDVVIKYQKLLLEEKNE